MTTPCNIDIGWSTLNIEVRFEHLPRDFFVGLIDYIELHSEIEFTPEQSDQINAWLAKRGNQNAIPYA